MQRQIIHGVPYFIDGANNLYLWDTETPAHRVGSYSKATDSVTFTDNHLSQLTDRLQVWRSKQAARPRKPTANRRGNSGGDAAESASDEDEE